MALYGGQVQTAPYQSPDYGPSVAAYKDLAMAGAQGMAGMVSQVGDYFKQQGEAKKSAQLGIKIAEAAKIMDPNQAPYYDNLIFSMKDENTPVQVRGALGASVQDLLKQNVSSRAVAVQEAQMNMRPAFFGGGKSMPTRAYNAPAIQQASRQGVAPSSVVTQDDLIAGQKGTTAYDDFNAIEQASNMDLYGGAPEGAPVNIKLNQVNDLLSKGASVNAFTPAENERIKQIAGNAAVAGNEQGLTAVIQDLQERYNKSEASLKVTKDEPIVEMQTPDKVRRVVKTQTGLLKDVDTGEIIDRTTGKSVSLGGNVSFITQDYINNLNKQYESQFNQDNPLLNPIDGTQVPGQLPDNFNPQSSIGTPEQRARVQGMLVENQGRAMVQNIPQGAIPTDQSLAYGNVEPQSAQIRISESSAPVDTSSFARSVGTVAQPAQAPKTDLIKQYNDITQLNPYQQELVNEAKIEASQSGASPNKAVSTELERNILFNRAFVPTSLPKQGVRIVTPEDKKRQSNALLAQAKTRTVDRVMAYELMNRFDTIQQILNHPQANEFFGQSLPEEEIKKLARDQGGIYALYANLKGQDLVGALANIKEKSGTAAGMAASETKALQEAANPLNSTQDWNSAKKTLMQLSSDTIRSGKKLGLTGVFSYADPNDKSKGFKAQELLRSTNEFDPIFEDEVEYYNKVDKLKSQIEGVPQQRATPQQTGQIQQAQPSFDAYGNAYQNILKKYNLPPR
jgi:hypothetical protein